MLMFVSHFKIMIIKKTNKTIVFWKMFFFSPVYLNPPEPSELFCCGIVGAAHALPQLVRVGHVVVHVICDIHKTWIHTTHRTRSTEENRSPTEITSCEISVIRSIL